MTKLHTDKILHEMGLAHEALTPLGKWGRGRLHLGASTTACQHIIPPVLPVNVFGFQIGHAQAGAVANIIVSGVPRRVKPARTAVYDWRVEFNSRVSLFIGMRDIVLHDLFFNFRRQTVQ